MVRMRRAFVVVLVAGALGAGCGGSDSPGTAEQSESAGSKRFIFGFIDDAPKFESEQALAPARELGARAFRVTLLWNPGQNALSAGDVASLDQAVSSAGDMRLVVAVYADSGSKAPLDAAKRDEYCGYVRSVLARYPAIEDVVIWNEPNKSFFWKPQFNPDGSSAAPAAYGALLARCWDVLHAFRSTVNVVGPATSPRGNDRPDARSNISHSPGSFIRALGAAYRTSGREQRILDTVGHHAYGHSGERPWKRHTGSTDISEGDWDKLMAALRDAFEGTGQPIPSECADGRCVPIWYLEIGYQTVPDPAKQALYSGAENDPHALPDVARGETASSLTKDSFAPDHATQIVDGVRLAYCQPYVEAFFNFLLWDEPDLGRWQAAPLWVDRTPKASFEAFRQVIAEVNAGTVDCSRLKGGSVAVP
jgi:hypothetical protein